MINGKYDRTLNKHYEKDSVKIDPITHFPVDIEKPYLGVLKEMICGFLNIDRSIVHVYSDEKNRALGSMTMLETLEHRLPRFFKGTKIKREIKEFYRIRGFELREIPETSDPTVFEFYATRDNERYKVSVDRGQDAYGHWNLEGFAIHVD